MDSSKRLFYLILLLGLISVAIAATTLGSASKQRSLLGGYQLIKNVKDPYVVEIAKFAMSEHDNSEPNDLVFVKVLSGQKQVVAGMNYKLIIFTMHGVHGPGSRYQAVVYDRAWEKYRSLTSFEAL